MATIGREAARAPLTSADINDGIVSADDLAATLDLSSKTLTLPSVSSLDVTGTVTADGLTVDGTGAEVISVNSTANGSQINFDSATTSSDWSVGIANDSTDDFLIYQAAAGSGDIKLYTDGKERLGVNNNGDISFYEDTGTTAKLFWDASAESLGINDTSPSRRLSVNSGGVQIAASFESTSTTSARIGLVDGNTTGDNYVNVAAVGDAMALYAGAAERLRITSGGNVGIGTSSPGRIVEVGGSQPAIKFNNGTHAWSIGTGAFVDGSDSFVLFQDGTGEALRVDSSGQVGIGESSPFDKLVVRSPDDNSVQSALSLKNGNLGATAGVALNFVVDDNNNVITSAIYGQRTASAYHQGSLQFLTRDSSGGGLLERMRIDSSGNLLVGKTATGFPGSDGVELLAGGVIKAGLNSAPSLYLNRGSTNGNLAEFYRSGVLVGSISVTASATAFNTSSDYRLKDVDGPITNSGAYIDALKPVQGSWKADGSRFIGLIAHEVQEVSETSIATGEKDGEEMQGMDYSAPELIANLIAEIQSLRARVAQLEGA